MIDQQQRDALRQMASLIKSMNDKLHVVKWGEDYYLCNADEVEIVKLWSSLFSSKIAGFPIGRLVDFLDLEEWRREQNETIANL